MSTRKLSAVFGLAAVGSMLLSACGSNATPIVVTAPPVIVKETVVSIQKEQSTVIVTQAAPATATVAPEWTRPHPILADVKVRQGIAHCTDRDKLIASVYDYVPDADKPKLRMDTFMPKTGPFYAANNPNVVDYAFDKAKGGALLEAAGWKLADKATVRANAKNEPLTLRFTTTNAQFRQTWGAV
ncbi:MAG TPA: ABC transporter substrate-binding protein, partial [Thermoflexales bacterium]|nr:ABC transporter substrate-binding protein [Thermoflexales bacterium]